MNSIDVEHTLVRNDWYAHNLKGKAYEKRMDKLNTSIKNAKTGEDRARFQKYRAQTIEKYNKYNNTNHKS